uniref:Uncharacterized protein n=1 Tax=Meloidogyne incognita TaxID=6306 RepID=A0A914NDD0_MELIC
MHQLVHSIHLEHKFLIEDEQIVKGELMFAKKYGDNQIEGHLEVLPTKGGEGSNLLDEQ